MFTERTSVGLDVHARSVVAAAIDTHTGKTKTARLVPSHEVVLEWVRELPGPVAACYEAGPTGYGLCRALLSAGIGLLVLWNAWRLLRESVDVLLEATPPEIDPAAVRDALGEIDGIEGIHDLHVWTVTSGLVALSSHVEVAPGSDWDRLLPEASDLLADRFGVGHITLQPETVGALPDAFRGCSLDSPEGVLACRSRVERAAPPAHAGHRH